MRWNRASSLFLSDGPAGRSVPLSTRGPVTPPLERKKKMKNPKEPEPEIVRGAILEIVQNQIRDNDPPETKETLDRLIAEGISEEEATKLIACAVSTEIFHTLKHREIFTEERYVKNLKKLPKLPWE